jgi:glycosyltransferase involved in cell wall biosynthesis
MNELPNNPWKNWAKRIVLHVPHYLSYNGDFSSGGRQRNVRDVARIVKKLMHRDCVIVQKAIRNWESQDKDGTPVIGLKSRLDVFGDPGFGLRTQKFLTPGDAIIYMGGEDAWPFFVKNAKGFHVGIWWDGPHSLFKKFGTSIRTQGLFQACRSVLCVDTNVINWLRTRSVKYQDAANRAVYIPNCVDLDCLPVRERSKPHSPLRIIFARRFEHKRGPFLALDAARILAKRGLEFQLIMSCAEGHDGSVLIRNAAIERGISDYVVTTVNDMDSIFSLYLDADISLVPTLWSEGTSYACIEAIAAGLPIVTTTVGGLPNLVFPDHNGFVCSPNPEEIAKAIEKYYDNELWIQHHINCLSMRQALSSENWTHRILKWLES